MSDPKPTLPTSDQVTSWLTTMKEIVVILAGVVISIQGCIAHNKLDKGIQISEQTKDVVSVVKTDATALVKDRGLEPTTQKVSGQ